jgi:hypothetical protein
MGDFMKKRIANRLNTAIRIRDAALEKIEKDGEFECNDYGLLLVWGDNELYITHTTPLQVFPPPGKDFQKKYSAADIDPTYNLPYGIDIWGGRGKVFNIEWDHNNQIDLICFRRGKWEQKVLQHMM